MVDALVFWNQHKRVPATPLLPFDRGRPGSSLQAFQVRFLARRPTMIVPPKSRSGDTPGTLWVGGRRPGLLIPGMPGSTPGIVTFGRAPERSLQALAQSRASALNAEGSGVKTGCTQTSFLSRASGLFHGPSRPSPKGENGSYGGRPLGPVQPSFGTPACTACKPTCRRTSQKPTSHVRVQFPSPPPCRTSTRKKPTSVAHSG